MAHVLISLLAIGAGFVVAFGLLTSKRLDHWTALFLSTTLATSLSGFCFPFHGITPAIITGIISLLILAVIGYARYRRHLTGWWAKVYAAGSVMVLYFNVFVLVVQSFQKIPALKDLAPTPNELPFQITQLVVLVIFVMLGLAATIRFRIESAHSQSGGSNQPYLKPNT